jgi:hypothetical protein
MTMDDNIVIQRRDSWAYTPSVLKCKASKLDQKSRPSKFDQVYIEKYEYLQLNLYQ